jgi:hypothetical protein
MFSANGLHRSTQSTATDNALTKRLGADEINAPVGILLKRKVHVQHFRKLALE